MDSERSPWYMVLYDPNNQRVANRGEALAARLLIYLLAPETVKGAKAKALRQDFAGSRTIDLGQHEGEARSLDGIWVVPGQVELPPPITL